MFPLDSNLFNEETQCTITLLSQFLSLDTDKYITDPLMSLIFVLSTCPTKSNEPGQTLQVSCLKFYDFLVETIHSQLTEFGKTKSFRFQDYSLKIFLSHNEENIQLPKMVLTWEMSKYY